MEPKKRILIVDDEPPILKVLKSRLLASGYEVITAENGADGIAVAKLEKPDLMIIDMLMTKMNGYETCVAAKRDPEICMIPIFILTAGSLLELEAQCLTVGAKAILRKPFDAKELLATIQKWFDAEGQKSK